MSEEWLVELRGLVPTPGGTGVFLGRQDSGKVIAIFIDPAIAVTISMMIDKIQSPRPMTHDLIGNIFLGLGIRATRVVIHDLREGTFYARLHLLQENEGGRQVSEIDARPSDCFVMALQQKCPVYVTRNVWDAAADMSKIIEEAGENGIITFPSLEEPSPGED